MHVSPIIELSGFRVDLSIVFMLLITCTVVFVLARLAVRNLSVENPSKLQNLMEWAVEFAQNIVGSAMDLKKGKPFVSLALTLVMFIFVANLLGLPLTVITDHHHPEKFLGQEITTISADKFKELHEKEVEKAEKRGEPVEEVEEPEIGLAWWKSPTADASVSLGLAFMMFCLIHFLGLTRNTKAYLKHYLHPYPFFLPLNIIEQLSKLLTHGMRLFGNIYAGEVLIGVLLGAGFAGIIPLVVWQGFSVFVGAIQAFVFTMLAMVYLAQAIVHEEEH